jgi:hypothetical protein
MKTIFDFSPTDAELLELFGYNKESDSMAYGFSVFSLPNKDYKKENNRDGMLLDLAKLFELRGQQKEAADIWVQIPDIERQYRSGFDYEVITF